MKIRELEDKIIELSNRVEKLEKEKTQKHEFKVGDRVQFKSWKEMEREFTSPWFWGSSTYFLLPGDFIFGQAMKYLCGTYATIKEITIDGKVILTDSTSNQGNINDWSYSLDMLKPAINEPKHWNFKEYEKAILVNLPKKYNWIARDYNGKLYVYSNKPKKDINFRFWVCGKNGFDIQKLTLCEHFFQTIQWEDNKPCEFRKFI